MIKNSYYDDFRKTLEVQDQNIRKEKTKAILSSFVFLIVVLLSGIFLIKDPSLLKIFPDKEQSQMVELSSRVDKLNGDLEKISSALNAQKNPSYIYLDSRVQNLEEKNSYLYQTILKDPDSAITPKILQNEQDSINEKITDLKAQVTKTNSQLSTIFITLVLGIICYIGRQIWETYFSKKTLLK